MAKKETEELIEINPGQVTLAKKLEGVEITTTLIKSQDFQTQYGGLADLVDYLTKLKKAVDAEIKEAIQKEYVETGESTISTDSYNFTYVSGSTKTSFDTKKFEEENPELYAKYTKLTNNSDSLRVTKKKKKEDKAKKEAIEADFSEIK